MLYLGNIQGTVLKSDHYLIKILLAAGKKNITKNWPKIDVRTLKPWMKISNGIQDMERLTYKIGLGEGQFERDWGKWSNYEQNK